MSLPEVLQQTGGSFLGVLIHGEEFAVPAVQVVGVIPTPSVRPVPRAPSFIAGVANVEGRIVPMLLAAERLGFPSEEAVARKLVLIRLRNAIFGMTVDAVTGLVDLSSESIDPVNPLLMDQELPFIAGMAREGERLRLLLDMEAFLYAGLDLDQEKVRSYEEFAARQILTTTPTDTDRGANFLHVQVAGESYAFRMAQLHEILPADRLVHLEEGPPHVMGLVHATGCTVPVLDLAARLGLSHDAVVPRRRIVIVDAGALKVGLLVDSVNEILHFQETQIQPPPRFLSGGGSQHVWGVATVPDTTRLVLLLAVDRLLGDEEVQDLNETEELQMGADQVQARTGILSLLVFHVADLELALELSALAEVLQAQPITRVPKAPTRLLGLISVRGTLIPLFSLRACLGLPLADPSRRARILITDMGGERQGFMVDAVSEIVRIREEQIGPLPELVDGVEREHLRGAVQLPGSDRAPLLLDLGSLTSI